MSEKDGKQNVIWMEDNLVLLQKVKQNDPVVQLLHTQISVVSDSLQPHGL